MAMPTPAELEHVKVSLQKAYYHPGQKRHPCGTCFPKCSKSRDLIEIAIRDSNRESQITSDLRQCEPPQKSSLF